jgi:hypothetical protein
MRIAHWITGVEQMSGIKLLVLNVCVAKLEAGDLFGLAISGLNDLLTEEWAWLSKR